MKKTIFHKQLRPSKSNFSGFQDSKANQLKHTQQSCSNIRSDKTNSKTGVKAYNLLALQLGISTNKAKKLIDRGVIQVNGKRLEIARTMLPYDTKFIMTESTSSIIFEDSNFLVLDKSIGMECYELEKYYPHCKLINRLDKDTSGVILMAKNEGIRHQAIQEFKAQRVEKIYFALVEGRLSEDLEISSHLSFKTVKSQTRGFVSTNGTKAVSLIKPIALVGKKTLLEIRIPTGKTHQIRIHLASIKHPIIGDIIYNKTSSKHAKRLMLHCHKTSLLHREFVSPVNVYKAFEINGD